MYTINYIIRLFAFLLIFMTPEGMLSCGDQVVSTHMGFSNVLKGGQMLMSTKVVLYSSFKINCKIKYIYIFFFKINYSVLENKAEGMKKCYTPLSKGGRILRMANLNFFSLATTLFTIMINNP